MEKISIEEMLNHLNQENRHDILCTCFQCEKEIEEHIDAVCMRLDLNEILRKGKS